MSSIKYLLVLLLVTPACGKSGNSGVATKTPIPKLPTNTAYQITLTASRTGAGVSTPGSSTMTQPSTITLPQPTDISIISNATDFYHASLTIGTVTCDYIHNAGASGFTNGAGCSTLNSTVPLQTNDQIQLSISTNVNQQTNIQLILNAVTQ